MSQDPLVLTLQTEQRVEPSPVDVQRPAPSVEQQQVADEVFSREQSQVVAAILGVQTGLAIVGHLVAETFPPTNEVEIRRTKKDGPPEE